METLDPQLLTASIALSAAVLMVHAGIAKRRLEWRPRHPNRPRRRRR
jgi:hypothetical protein